jgi:hypothetical protein
MAECVKVVVRARPLNKREKDLGILFSNLFRNKRVFEICFCSEINPNY